MYFKLSFRNARRQARDYLVYFVTIVMVAALVYAFNGLVFSEELQSLSKLLVSLPAMIVLASAVVIAIIGWLVSYTVNFMLLRRSREFGLYVLIGLENRQVARLFFMENLLVGGCALGCGLLLGNLLFQMLRAVILALFGAAYTFSFSFSWRAVGLTLVYFGLIYLFAQWKSRKRIRCMKIYDLIYFDRLNEGMVIRTDRKRRRIFRISLVLGLLGTVLLMVENLLIGILGAGCIIAFLYSFFLSFASGVPAYFEKHPERKYQGQVLLIFRTLTAKLATMGIVMATISLLFTATLISEGTGMVFRAIFRGRMVQKACFDLFLSTYDTEDRRYTGCLDYMDANIPMESSWEYNIYLGQSAEVMEHISEKTDYYRYYEYDTVMKASDYAVLREMLGYPAASPESGHYLIQCQTYVADALKGWDRPVTVGGQELSFGGMRAEPFAQYFWDANGQGYILVVPDEAAEGCQASHSVYAAMAAEPVSEEQYHALDDIADDMVTEDNWEDVMLCVKANEEAQDASMTAMLVFPLYYLAIVLTMTAATILTIQQLAETGRYRHQFGLLRKLGMERQEMEGVLRRQFAFYYAMPAMPPVLIGVPFIVHLCAAVEPGVMVGMGHPLVIAGIALGIFLVIYAVYILLAYTNMKRGVLPE